MGKGKKGKGKGKGRGRGTVAASEILESSCSVNSEGYRNIDGQQRFVTNHGYSWRLIVNGDGSPQMSFSCSE